MLETNVWGQMYYATELERALPTGSGGEKGMNLASLVGCLLVYLEHARMMYSQVGFDGVLRFFIRLERILRVPFLYTDAHGFPELSPNSRLDDTLQFYADLPSEDLQGHRDNIARELLRTIFLGLNWQNAATEESIIGLVNRGYKYNGWEQPTSA